MFTWHMKLFLIYAPIWLFISLTIRNEEKSFLYNETVTVHRIVMTICLNQND